ncbi:MGDG synthase family glycosyltransferase [Gorillibacterium sp. sgz500922]|uniref:MGDG synthase family glycosyltransferase n=1 Tax=Gorillibacterium sp. sgz500922 TaxID=3446694 RepID=UPI003F66C184
MANRKVLLLYAGYGDGHLQVSRALREGLRDRGIDSVLVDLIALSHPCLDAFCRRFYRSSYTWFPHVYGWMYGATNRLSPEHALLNRLNSLGRSALRALVDREKPDLIVNTFPMPALPVNAGIPVCTVLTDFTAHSRWLSKQADVYYVATEDLAKELHSKGVPAERTRVSGIPTLERFRRPVGCDRIHARFGLSARKKTLLVMAGAAGIPAEWEQMSDGVLASPELQTVFVCGHNRPLRLKLEAAYRHAAQVRVFGYVEDISMLMAVSFALVTKAGGVTLSEALTANLPAILFRPVPGQERANAHYLASKGAAMIAMNGSELSHHILRLLRDEPLQRHMRDSIARLRQPRSAETVAADIAEHLASGRWTGKAVEASSPLLAQT